MASLATLKDIKSSIENIIRFIKEQLNKLDANSETSQRMTICNSIDNNLKLLKTNLTSMNFEITCLGNEQAETAFKSEYQAYKQEHVKLEETYKLKKEAAKGLINLIVNNDIANKKNSELTAQQLFDKGDRVVDESGKAINRIQKVVKEDLNIADAIKRDLDNQINKLDNVQSDLKEIDYSLNRATKQLKVMFRMYATDKLILGLIVLIVLAIIAIIIVSAVGGDKGNNFNVPHDIFSKNSTRLLFLGDPITNK